jgi:hypothetical protein
MTLEDTTDSSSSFPTCGCGGWVISSELSRKLRD